jgi:nucleotide-binding universal stress UspA family protein
LTAQAEIGGRIVVGVDGSEPSKAALAWAICQAGLTGALVEAVIAWARPIWVRHRSLMPGLDWEGLATQVLGDAVADAASGTEPVEIKKKAIRGNPAQVLVEESAGAELLVLGSRGFGGFAGALLRSTGQQCVHHASCPVVVIRGSAASPSYRATFE